MQIKRKIVCRHTADSKPVKQEVNSTVILPPLVFPGQNSSTLAYSSIRSSKSYISYIRSNRRSTGTVILPPLVFPANSVYYIIDYEPLQNYTKKVSSQSCPEISDEAESDKPGNTKGRSITAPLTYSLTCLD